MGEICSLPRPKRRRLRPHGPAKLLQFVPKNKGPLVAPAMVRQLELLMQHALSGNLDGFAWIAIAGERGYYADVAGVAQANPGIAAKLLMEHAFKLYQQAHLDAAPDFVP